ncbi:MAG TPA: hypothetical protein VF698_06735 [Thermoanaerobaculia bacterium]
MAYYSLNLTSNAQNGAYYSVTVDSPAAIIDGSMTLTPNSTSYTYFSAQGAVTAYVPGGELSSGGTVSTSGSTVSGQVYVSPAVSSPVQIVLYGRGSVLGNYTLPAGQTSGNFSFNVSSSEGVEDVAEAQRELAKILKAPEKP